MDPTSVYCIFEAFDIPTVTLVKFRNCLYSLSCRIKNVYDSRHCSPQRMTHLLEELSGYAVSVFE